MSIERVKDAAEHVKLTREMFGLFSQVRLPDGDPAKPLYSVSDIKVGELPALELMTDLSAAFAAGEKRPAGGHRNVSQHVRQALWRRR